jgi:hypothetical protein
LSKELNICNDSISCLRTENVILIAKIEELNACIISTSNIEHVTIYTRCRDVNIDTTVGVSNPGGPWTDE